MDNPTNEELNVAGFPELLLEPITDFIETEDLLFGFNHTPIANAIDHTPLDLTLNNNHQREMDIIDLTLDEEPTTIRIPISETKRDSAQYVQSSIPDDFQFGNRFKHRPLSNTSLIGPVKPKIARLEMVNQQTAHQPYDYLSMPSTSQGRSERGFNTPNVGNVDSMRSFPLSVYSKHTVTCANLLKKNDSENEVSSTYVEPNVKYNITSESENEVSCTYIDPNVKFNWVPESMAVPFACTNDNQELLMLNQLTDMFPDVDQQIFRTLSKEGLGTTQIIEEVLEMKSNYSKQSENNHINTSSDNDILPMDISEEGLQSKSYTNTVEKTEECVKTNNQFEFLVQIFPKADAKFLREKSTLKDEELTAFISDAMEKHNYPKLVEEIKNEQEDVSVFTTNFSVQSYLKIFPDPFSYFYDEKRICHSSSDAKGFMKKMFRWQSMDKINYSYKKFNFNLTRTCDYLETLPRTMKSKRVCSNSLPNYEGINITFLQEMCFVVHKLEIKDYMDSIEDAKKQAFAKAESRGELIECGCCYSQVVFEDCASCNEGDLFCKTCIIKGAEIRIGDGHTTFPCLADCGSHFSLHCLQNLLEARVFSRLLQRIQLDEVKAADIDGLEICPFCEYATIPPPDTNIFTCLNSDCLKESCRKCHKVSHIPQRCEEVENDDQARARKYIEDEMTKALVRECYSCKKSFIKTDGCNKMTCTCGAKMCYICRQPVKDYTHFNGPCGSNVTRCPLYSSDKLLHVDAIKAVAEKAKQDIAASNPELKLKHDPTKVLPSTAVSDQVPPGVVEDPDRLIANMQQGALRFMPFIQYQPVLQPGQGIIIAPVAPQRRAPNYRRPIQRMNEQPMVYQAAIPVQQVQAVPQLHPLISVRLVGNNQGLRLDEMLERQLPVMNEPVVNHEQVPEF